MLRTDLTDHRGTDDARLVRAVADGDAIALAEAYHRTITAAHACARRLLASPVEIEALLRSVFNELWQEPPVDEALEGWVRARCFALGTGYLRQRDLHAPSPSLAEWTSGVDAERQDSNDPLERMIAELTPAQQAALVRAHDQGIRTTEQDDANAGEALQHALLLLASPLTDEERHAAEMCSSGVSLANWIFGLLPPHEAATVPGTAAEPTPCGRLAGVLRRARRRFEPLPPTPDLGHRVLAWVLGNGQSRDTQETRASRLDSDLRIASTNLDRGARGHDAPRSSLDMTLPATPAADNDHQPISALQQEASAAPAARMPDDGGPQGSDYEQPTALRAPAIPPALAGAAAGAAPPAFGNTAPALAPHEAEPDDEASEELVRMPLQRAGRTKLATARGRDAFSPKRPDDDPETASPGRDAGQDVTAPPGGVRPRPGDDVGSSRAPQPAANPLAFDPGGGPAPSPLTGPERQRPLSERDTEAESPLRRPAPAGPTPQQGRELDTAPQAFTGHQDRGAHVDRPAVHDADATVKTPIQRDDSDPRVDDLFGRGTDSASDAPDAGADHVSNMTAPTLPAARRPTPPPPARPPGENQAAVAGLASPETEGTGNSVLRWLVVLLLIAAGAAVGIMLGQALI